MRICLASIHPRRLSGQIDSLVALTRELRRLGHTAWVVSAFDEAVLFGEEQVAEGRAAGASVAGKLACMLRSSRRLAAVGQEADVIHLNLPTPAFSWLADLLALRPGGPPLVVGYEAHLADAAQLLRGGYLRRDPGFYLPRVLINNGLFGRLSLHRGRRYVVASHWQRAELRALGVDEARIASLPNLVDREKLHPPAKEAARRAIAPAVAGPLVGWAGHFHHVKGIEVLLDAFGQLSRQRPDARLALAWSGIGDPGPVEARVRALGLDEHVVRLGRQEMGCFLAALDVLALPYRLSIGQGAYPNLVLEAMTVGVPLVTGDLPLLRELVADGQTALLVRPDDRAGLASAIGRLLDEPGLARAMVEAQGALMNGRLSPAVLVPRYLELYRQVIGREPDR